MRRALVVVLTAAVAFVALPGRAADGNGACPADRHRLDALEAAIAGAPEDLRRAADYRQIVIACGDYDRSTRLFEKLAKQQPSGPNIQISLALAYVDKVPVSGDIRRLYLGRDAMNALTRAIARQPSVLAYYVRGVINLFYNNFIFHRARLGVEDLRKAAALINADTPPALAERVWVSLGDGYWRAEDRTKARETWAAAAVRFPSSLALKTRLEANDEQTGQIVRRALHDSTRVDTSLRNVISE